MKMLKFVLLLFSVWLTGCEVPFNPEADFEQKYIVNAIIDCDTSYQIVYVQRSYNPDDYQLNEYNENTFVSGAIVTISTEQHTFILEEKEILAENNSRYNGKISVYETDNFAFENGNTLSLTVELPDGSILTGSTVPPEYSRFRYSFSSDRIIPDYNDNYFDVEWDILDVSSFGRMFLRELKITYLENINGENIYKEINVPVNYIENRGELIPDFPLPDNSSEISYSMAAIDKTMELISEGKPDKSKFTILNAGFHVVLFDQNLAPYYMSTESFQSGYTVILDRIDYSNITGGYGIFASFRKEIMDTIIIDPLYINSFGYKHQ